MTPPFGSHQSLFGEHPMPTPHRSFQCMCLHGVGSASSSPQGICSLANWSHSDCFLNWIMIHSAAWHLETFADIIKEWEKYLLSTGGVKPIKQESEAASVIFAPCRKSLPDKQEWVPWVQEHTFLMTILSLWGQLHSWISQYFLKFPYIWVNIALSLFFFCLSQFELSSHHSQMNSPEQQY